MALLVGLAIAPAWGAQPTPVDRLDPDVRKAANALGMVRWSDYATGPDREDLDLINRLEFTGSGTVHGKTRNGAWSRLELKQLTVGASLLIPAIRRDQTVVDATGNPKRSIEVARESLAWDESAPGAPIALLPGKAPERIRELYLLPHGFMRAVLRSAPGDLRKMQDAAGNIVLEVTIDGQRARATLGKDWRPTRIDLPIRGGTLGSGVLVSEMSDYKDFEGYEVYFPTRIVHTFNGRPLLDLTVARQMTGVYLAYPPPPPASAAK